MDNTSRPLSLATHRQASRSGRIPLQALKLVTPTLLDLTKPMNIVFQSVLVALALILSIARFAAADSADWDAVEQRATQAMVFVYSYLQPDDRNQPRIADPLWKGTGFIITPQGHIL